MNIRIEKYDVSCRVPRQEMSVLSMLLLEKERVFLDEISIALLTDEALMEINLKRLNHDYFTDIITFDNRNQHFAQVELCMSYDRIAENARNFDVSFRCEFLRVFAHGLLHIAGYNDATLEEIQIMRAKELEYLELVSRETGRKIC